MWSHRFGGFGCEQRVGRSSSPQRHPVRHERHGPDLATLCLLVQQHVQDNHKVQGFSNPSDMDSHGAAFIPFLDHQAATRLARSFDAAVQRVVGQILSERQGDLVRFVLAWAEQ